MTARRSSATERRGVGGITPRPAVLSAAVLAVALAGSGCASRNANTAGMAAPFNQDTGAPAKDGGLPHTPPADRRQAAHLAVLPTITALPSATSTLPDATTDPVPTETDLGNTIVAELLDNRLTIGLTPEENPAAPNPVLEVVGMPMWLWVNGLPPALKVTRTTGGVTSTITVWAAMDRVTWSTGSAPGPSVTCGNGTTSPSTGKGYGIPYDIAFDPAGTDAAARNACVTSFSAPYYAGGGGPLTAGVYDLTGTVEYHIAFTLTDAGGTTAPAPVADIVAGTVTTQPARIRVGEIQALATSP